MVVPCCGKRNCERTFYFYFYIVFLLQFIFLEHIVVDLVALLICDFIDLGFGYWKERALSSGSLVFAIMLLNSLYLR